MRTNLHRGRFTRRLPRFACGGLFGLTLIGLLSGAASAAVRPSPLAGAQKSLLRLSDLPNGWRAVASSNDNSAVTNGASLAKCLGVSPSFLNYNAPSVNSPQFSDSTGLLSVSDSVSVYPSAGLAAHEHALMGSSKVPGCFTAAMNGPLKASTEAQFGAGATMGRVVVGRALSTDFAPGSQNFVIAAPVTEKGVTVELTVVEVDYVKGNVEQTVSLIAVDTPFPISLAHQLTTDAAVRI